MHSYVVTEGRTLVDFTPTASQLYASWIIAIALGHGWGNVGADEIGTLSGAKGGWGWNNVSIAEVRTLGIEADPKGITAPSHNMNTIVGETGSKRLSWTISPSGDIEIRVNRRGEIGDSVVVLAVKFTFAFDDSGPRPQVGKLKVLRPNRHKSIEADHLHALSSILTPLISAGRAGTVDAITAIFGQLPEDERAGLREKLRQQPA